jgi:hypothetical protein
MSIIMDNNLNEMVDQASTNIHNIIRINNEEYRIYQQRHPNIGYRDVSNKYFVYLIKSVLLEMILIFFIYLKNPHSLQSTIIETETQHENNQVDAPVDEPPEIVNNNRDIRDFMVPNENVIYIYTKHYSTRKSKYKPKLIV